MVDNDLLSNLNSKINESVFVFNEFENTQSLNNNEFENIHYNEFIQSETAFCWATSSGSLASPKITEHSYLSILEDTFRQITNNNITQNDRLDIVSTMSFSSSLASIFPAMYAGASIHFFINYGNISEIYHFWKEQKITFSNLVPSLFRVLLKMPYNFNELSLRFICISGEACKKSDLELFKSKFNKEAILQIALASSETRTIGEFLFKSSEEIPKNEHIELKPIIEKGIRIVNEHNEIVAESEIGRIAVLSKIIGKKYINSDSNFVKLEDEKRLFISDDQAYKLSNGNFILLPKTTRILKFKGQFIDLDQIEKEILAINTIKECFVCLNDENTSIFAFVSSHESFEVIREKISQYLPKFNIQVKVFNDLLTRTRTGKIDIKQLISKTKEEDKHQEKNTYYLVWKTTFPLCDNFNNKHFFNDLGGDSLLAMIFIDNLSKLLHIEIEPNQIYLFPIYEEFEKSLENKNSFGIHSINEVFGNKLNILFFPSVNGNLERYSYIMPLLSEKFNIYIIKYSVRKDNIFIHSDLIAQQCALVIQASNIKIDSIIGYSFSGLLAYKTICKLKANIKLVLIDTPTYQKLQLKDKFYNAIKFFCENHKNINELKEYISNFTNRLKTHSGKKNKQNIKSIKIFYDDFYLSEFKQTNIIPASNIQIGLFCASDKSHFQNDIKPDYSWEKYTNQLIFKKTLIGNHFSVVNEANSNKIANEISQFLMD